MPTNNCPSEVVSAFQEAGLNIGDDNFSKLARLKGGRFTPVLQAVLDCSVCSASGGHNCVEAVSVDVIEVALEKGIMPENQQTTDYFRTMSEEAELRIQQIKSGE